MTHRHVCHAAREKRDRPWPSVTPAVCDDVHTRLRGGRGCEPARWVRSPQPAAGRARPPAFSATHATGTTLWFCHSRDTTTLEGSEGHARTRTRAHLVPPTMMHHDAQQQPQEGEGTHESATTSSVAVAMYVAAKAATRHAGTARAVLCRSYWLYMGILERGGRQGRDARQPRT